MKVRGIHGQLFDPTRRSFVAIRTHRRIFPHVRIALAFALVACSSKADKAPPPAPADLPRLDEALPVPDAPVELTRSCLPPELEHANVAYLRSDGPRVTVCYGNGDDSPGSTTHCLVLDENGDVLGPRTFEDAERARLARRELPSPTVDVEIDEDVTRRGVGTHDKTRAFVFEERDGRVVGVFYDLRTNKQIGAIDLAELDRDGTAFTRTEHVREARWVGHHVIVTDRVEVGPEHLALLVSPSGDHVVVGNERSSHTIIDDELIVVMSGKSIRLIDVRDLAEIRSLVAPGTSSPLGDVAVAAFSDHLVVAHARPAGVIFVGREKPGKGPDRVLSREIRICSGR